MSQNDNFNSLLRLTLEYASEAGYKLEKANLDLENLQNKFNLLQNKMEEEKRYKTVGVQTEQGTRYTREEYESDDDSDNVPTNGFDYEKSEELSEEEIIKARLESVKVILEDLKTKGVKFRNMKSFWAQLNEKIEGKKRKKKTRSKKLKRAYKILSGGNNLSNPVTKSN